MRGKSPRIALLCNPCFLSYAFFDKYSATPSAEAFIPDSPWCQLAGQTSPFFSKNCNASTMRSASAVLRPNGKSFITLYSTAMVKNPVTGEREEISKIVTTLKPGAAVTLSRNDVDYVVTEYGCVCLRGTTIEERVKLLISIAHPKFRDKLLEEAKQLEWIF